MSHPSDKIASLIGSRICHDLISPVGAVANGLELLELSGLPKSPEFSLVTESAGHASARIQFFRLAFGDAEPEQVISGQGVADILAAVYQAGRIKIDWRAQGDFPRPQMKAAMLAVMCMEQPLVVGGTITILHENGRWHIRAEASRLAPDPVLWNILKGEPGPDEVTPAAVQFLLLPQTAKNFNLNIATQVTDEKIEISF